MCGIAGVVCGRDIANLHSIVLEMTQSLVHRQVPTDPGMDKPLWKCGTRAQKTIDFGFVRGGGPANGLRIGPHGNYL